MNKDGEVENDRTARTRGLSGGGLQRRWPEARRIHIIPTTMHMTITMAL